MATQVPPTLENLLYRHGLKSTDLMLACPRDVRHEVAVKIVDWKMVGHCFSVPKEKLAAIDRDNETEDQRRVALLEYWSEREGSEASYFKLASVLHQRNRNDLVDLLCDKVLTAAVKTITKPQVFSIVPPVDSSTGSCLNMVDTIERIETLEMQFNNLYQQLLSELSKTGCSTEKILQQLTILPMSVRKENEGPIRQMLPELDEGDTTTKLFLRLSPLFTFIDYGLLKHLILTLGSAPLIEKMKSYVSMVQVFKRETTVGELMDHWPGIEPTNEHYSKLRMKISDDPLTYSLEKLDKFRRKFCSEMMLSEFICVLIRLEAGESFFVEWLVPAIVAPELMKIVGEVEQGFYEMEHVVMISLGQNLLYSSVLLSDSKHAEEDVAPSSSPVDAATQIKAEVEAVSQRVASCSITVHHESPEPCPDQLPDYQDKAEDRELTENEKEIGKLKALVAEKNLEIQVLETTLENAHLKERMHSLTIQELASMLSQRVAELPTAVEEGTTGEGEGKSLQEMKTELQELTFKLQLVANERVKGMDDVKVELEREDIGRIQKGLHVSKWLEETSSVPTSESGFVSAVNEPSIMSELPGESDELFDQYLQDLAKKEEELATKEKEMKSRRDQLAIAISNQNEIISVKHGEAEQFKQSIRELEKMLRMKNEEVVSLSYELQQFHTQMEAIQSGRLIDEKEFYRMDKNPHGICVIINNYKFHHPTDPEKAHPDRGGAEVDQYNLQVTFQYLRYKVEVYENLTSTQMKELMLSMAQRNHTNYDSFICCILSHGEENTVHGADSIPVSLPNLMRVMEMCTTLINKPKMFFIQAVRGDLEIKGYKLEVEESVPADSNSRGLKERPTPTIPKNTDFFFGYATPLGNVAYRSRRHGSWYISELCKVLTMQGYTTNLGNMMRKVNDNICRAFTKEGYKQTSEFVDRLRKEVHFFHFFKVQQQPEEQLV